MYFRVNVDFTNGTQISVVYLDDSFDINLDLHTTRHGWRCDRVDYQRQRHRRVARSYQTDYRCSVERGWSAWSGRFGWQTMAAQGRGFIALNWLNDFHL